MRKYDRVKNLAEEDFKRLTGVKRKTFHDMIEILNQEELKKKAGGGKPNILSLEDRLLMALEYLREYRTYFHVSQSYGVTESTCYRNCRWIEDVLIRSGKFSLPGKKELLKSDIEYEVLLIDASESPIERPKKKSPKQKANKK
jgi:Helix-turn-helix of DDE superfamily endonuclease